MGNSSISPTKTKALAEPRDSQPELGIPKDPKDVLSIKYLNSLYAYGIHSCWIVIDQKTV